MNSGIYTITNTVNGMAYIGRSSNWKSRMAAHKFKLKANKHENPKLQRAYNKYGVESFSFELVCCESPELLEELEGLILEELFESGKIYNCHKSSDGGTVGRKNTEEFKLSRTGINNPMFGKTHSAESRAVQSLAAKKQAMTRKDSGWSMPKDIREKHSVSLKGKAKTIEHNRNRAMSQLGKLYDTPFGVFYTSKECEEATGIKAATVMWRCKNSYLDVWKYTNIKEVA